MKLSSFARSRLAALLALAIVLPLSLSACGGGRLDPLFTSPEVKLAALADPLFTQELVAEAVAYEPKLTQSGMQVHMGYWSGAGNHGSLVRLLDSINAQPAEAAQKAIWDEGVQTSLQYPSYVTMLDEHWYDRAAAVDGVVTIYGEAYTDPFPVTFEQADEIWGSYSQDYADMAGYFQQATGNVVKSWCYVQGARANRIFYTYEYPKLQELEAAGTVQVFFAITQDADWQDPEDWTEGTASSPPPAASVSFVEQTSVEDSPRGIPWDAF